MHSMLQSAPHPSSLKAELRGETSAKQPRWLTEVVATSVHAVRGTVKRLAAALGERESAVYERADINHPKPVPAWWLPTLCRETGSFAVLDEIERQVGRRAFQLPAMDPIHGEFFEQASALVVSIAETVDTLPGILKDGRIDADERARFRSEAERAIADLWRLVSMVEQKAERDAA